MGELVFPIIREHVAQTLLVRDDDIRKAQAALRSELRVVAEPGGAAAFAVLLAGRYQPAPDERVAVLVCGGTRPRCASILRHDQGLTMRAARTQTSRR